MNFHSKICLHEASIHICDVSACACIQSFWYSKFMFVFFLFYRLKDVFLLFALIFVFFAAWQVGNLSKCSAFAKGNDFEHIKWTILGSLMMSS